MAKHPIGNLIIAEAILVDNVSVTLQAKNFIYYNKPIYPAEIFKDEKEALNWLYESYLKSKDDESSINYG